MGQVIRTPEAEVDLRRIVSRIADDNPAAALEWLQKTESLFELLANQPDLGERLRTRHWGAVRRCASGVYLPYYHRVAVGVEILRVTHGARDQTRIV